MEGDTVGTGNCSVCNLPSREKGLTAFAKEMNQVITIESTTFRRVESESEDEDHVRHSQASQHAGRAGSYRLF